MGGSSDAWRKHLRLEIHIYREYDEVIVQVFKNDKCRDEVSFHVSEKDEFYKYIHNILKEVIE